MPSFEEFFVRPKWDDLRSKLRNIGYWAYKEDPFGGMDRIISRITSELLPHAAALIGKPADTLQRIVKARIVDEPEINGFTYPAEDDSGFNLDVNIGLTVFLNNMGKLLAARTVEEDNGDAMTTAFSFDETVSATIALLQAFWTRRFVPNHWLDTLKLNDDQLLQASMSRLNAERFVVAHELGHVVILTCGGKIAELDAGMAAARRATAATLLSNGQCDTQLEQWTPEIAADLVGWELYRKVIMTDPLSIMYGVLGVEMLFLMLDMLARFEEMFTRKSSVRTHPPALLRLSILREVIRGSPLACFLQLGLLYEQLANAIRDAAFETLRRQGYPSIL